MLSENLSSYSELRAFQAQFLLQKNLKDTVKQDAENSKRNIFIPEGSSIFVDQQDEKEICVGFFGGCSALYRNMWLRKSLSLFNFDLKMKTKIEISSVTTINPSNRTAEVSPIGYGSSFYVKQNARSDLIVFGGKDLNFGYLSNEIQVFERSKGKATFTAHIFKSETMRQYPNIRNQKKQSGAIPSPRYGATITTTADVPSSSGTALLFGGFTQPHFAEFRLFFC